MVLAADRGLKGCHSGQSTLVSGPGGITNWNFTSSFFPRGDLNPAGGKAQWPPAEWQGMCLEALFY